MIQANTPRKKGDERVQCTCMTTRQSQTFRNLVNTVLTGLHTFLLEARILVLNIVYCGTI